MDTQIEEGASMHDINEDELEDTTNSGILSRMALNDNKAGMEGLDKEKINRIIHENSVGSKFYENERKKDAQADARIQKLLEQVGNITPEQMDAALGQTNAILKKLEMGRDLSKIIVHIDMDAFYASVEERENPDLKNKPMAVGGMGMLSTSNYVARRYGVRAAMPGFIGRKLCPDLILVPLNFAKYTEVSNEIRKVLACYDPNFMPMGLDEAYLDITLYLEERKYISEEERTFIKCCTSDGSTRKETITFGISCEEVVNEIRFKIQQETQLTASAGIAPNTLLAKVASDMNKPNGQFVIDSSREKVMEFITTLPIRKVSGIGKVTEKMLNAIGVKTCNDLYEKRAVLYTVFSQTMSNYCLRICIGIGSTTLESDSERKSISTERTFRNISNAKEMYRKCQELCEALESDAKKANIKGLTITLKIKTAAFELHTKSKTLFHPVSCKSEVYPVIADLLKQELAAKNGQLTLRLIGVGLSKLTKGRTEGQQRSLDYFMQKSSTIRNCKKEGNDEGHEVKSGARDQQCLDEYNTILKENEHTNLQMPDGTNGYHEKSDSDNADQPVPVCHNNPEVSSISSFTAEYHCPICSSAFRDLPTLNSHVDKCVSPQKCDSKTKSVHLGLKVSQCNDNNNDNSMGDEITCLTCPICNATFCCQDITLEKFNTHVDSCLNRKTVMELVKAESSLFQSTSSKRNSGKLEYVDTGPPKKRHKKSKIPLCTLDKFFK